MHVARMGPHLTMRCLCMPGRRRQGRAGRLLRVRRRPPDRHEQPPRAALHPLPQGPVHTHSALRSHTHTHAQQTQETIFGPQGRASRAQPWFDPVRASSRFIGQLRPRHRRRQGLSRQPHLPAAVVASLGLRRLRPRGRHGGGCAAAPLPEGRLEARGHGGASCAVDVCRSSAALC